MRNFKYYTSSREPFFDIALKHITPSSKVLDVGAGNGAFSKYCQRNDFYLFDSNESTIMLLKEKNKNVIHGILSTLPFKTSFFDLIHCSHVIEHLTPEIFYNTLKEMDRCLKPNGLLIISTPLLWEGFFDDLSHVKPYNPQVLKNYLCTGNDVQRTRKKISSDYRVENLTYRYRKLNLAEKFIPTHRSKISVIVLRFLNFLNSRGIKRVEKTGYTIVLKKQE